MSPAGACIHSGDEAATLHSGMTAIHNLQPCVVKLVSVELHPMDFYLSLHPRGRNFRFHLGALARLIKYMLSKSRWNKEAFTLQYITIDIIHGSVYNITGSIVGMRLDRLEVEDNIMTVAIIGISRRIQEVNNAINIISRKLTMH